MTSIWSPNSFWQPANARRSVLGIYSGCLLSTWRISSSLRPCLADPFKTIVNEESTGTGSKNAKRKHSISSDVAFSRKALSVDSIDHYGNRRLWVERLISAWNQAIREDAESEYGADAPLIGASTGTKETTSSTPHGHRSGRYANSPRAERERECAGAPVRNSPRHGMGKDALSATNWQVPLRQVNL